MKIKIKLGLVFQNCEKKSKKFHTTKFLLNDQCEIATKTTEKNIGRLSKKKKYL